jgi:hypothetical protein
VRQNNGASSDSPAGRFVGAVAGFFFFCVGIGMIIFLWSFSAGDFDAPPPFFRFVGTMMGLVFMAVGGTACVTSFTGKGMNSPQQRSYTVTERTPAGPTAAPQVGENYVCPNCGGRLGAKADVSPLGDVKCPFCGSWFNIHGRTTAT